MDNEITPTEFRFKDKHVVRTLERNGELWFSAADACAALELDNISQAISRLDEDEKDEIISNDTTGKPNRLNLVNESGLYNLILGSRKPSAKDFKRWVTHEVLPTIRKTGGYSLTPSEPLTPAQILVAMAKQFEAQEKILADHDQRLADIEHRQSAIEQGSKYFTILAYATRRGMHLDKDTARVFGMNASRYSRDQGYEIGKSNDQRYGYVNAYHEDVLDAVFGSGKPLLSSGE